jgi:hypothetical protein
MINQQPAPQAGGARPRRSTAPEASKLPVTDWVASAAEFLFVAAVEFGDACRDFPIVFVRAGTDPAGKPQVAPVAVFGLGSRKRTCTSTDRWRGALHAGGAAPVPVCMGRVDAETFAMCVDTAGSVCRPKGEALFDAAGEPSELT